MTSSRVAAYWKPRPLEPLEQENNALKTTIVCLRRELENKGGHVERLKFLLTERLNRIDQLTATIDRLREQNKRLDQEADRLAEMGAVVVKAPSAKTLKTRLLRRITKQDNGCWEWTGARSTNGQGAIQIAHKLYATHRLAYLLWRGPIPPHHRVRHRCRNLACINPQHLYLTDLEQRLLRKIEKQANGCWVWRGYINKKGYGRIILSGHRRNVHRLAYELWVEQIPERLQVQHLCGNSLCCNPAHLVAGTVSENAALRTQNKRVKGQSVTTFPDAHIE
jgi:hypothetical protein